MQLLHHSDSRVIINDGLQVTRKRQIVLLLVYLEFGEFFSTSSQSAERVRSKIFVMRFLVYNSFLLLKREAGPMMSSCALEVVDWRSTGRPSASAATSTPSIWIVSGQAIRRCVRGSHQQCVCFIRLNSIDIVRSTIRKQIPSVAVLLAPSSGEFIFAVAVRLQIVVCVGNFTSIIIIPIAALCDRLP